ncbi:MAG: SLBB domain-containing protein, partial [Atribacterota bacterium]
MELTRQEKIVLFFLVGAVFASLIFFLSRVFVYRIPGSSPTPNTEIVVQIEGEVRKPGVFRVPGGMRVYELIEMAGGSQPGADLSGLNLAAPLQDGQRLVVSTSPPEKGTFTRNFSTLASSLPPPGKKNDLPSDPPSVNV